MNSINFINEFKGLRPWRHSSFRGWTRWNADLPQAEARVLLRWLEAFAFASLKTSEARRETTSSLGLVCTPLKSALTGLSAELSLRMGAHLRGFERERAPRG